MSLRSGVPLPDPHSGEPEPQVSARRAQDLVAVLLIVTGVLGLLVSLWFVHPLAASIGLCLMVITVGLALGLE